MKQSEIKPCANCGKGILHDNNIMFYKLKVSCLVIDINAVRRQIGLKQMLGGNKIITSVMGTDEDLAKPLYEHEILVCLECSMKPLVQILEDINA